ncbi:unnamed protein product [Lactuca saligna]|uniref:3'-5' exonuclease domain-containing protein n=1 Tax=Lactuca saligna TaxID=75948 RepID=A0AA35Z8C1_LACSI|nr:unnamed protein product [Lactuca saligna]
MVINGRRRWSYHTTHTKNISFYEQDIYTTVTKDPNSVTSWISSTTENNNGHHHPLVIGLDVEWRPSYRRGVENRVAILQLCVDHRCLVFQIIHSPYIPELLIDFLNNPSYTFTGVRIHDSIEKMVGQYSLGRAEDGLRLAANVVDLGWLAAQVYGKNMHVLGLKSLAKVVLQKEPEMPAFVTVSRWDDQWLFPEQMEYASVDGFLSFEIGRVLISMGASLY